ncbi:MAG: hypothetical protein GY742_19765 [Hyphomicrobiales bacterium]|nr:hypothetical protein [Hyphomicrobiales bacterium]
MKLDKLVNAAKQVRLDLNSGTISRWFPPAEWLATYNTNTFSSDLVAARAAIQICGKTQLTKESFPESIY